MRFAMISDIHGNIWALEAVLATIRAMGDIDMIVNPGDILSGPLEPAFAIHQNAGILALL
ncbi:metallophosphoesterase [Cupriavidus plantarum]|uniref:metallophosphoesterase n=1 Tax=Cupriavidus plantarum TaxID=942865 RepID=UPI000EAFB76D